MSAARMRAPGRSERTCGIDVPGPQPKSSSVSPGAQSFRNAAAAISTFVAGEISGIAAGEGDAADGAPPHISRRTGRTQLPSRCRLVLDLVDDGVLVGIDALPAGHLVHDSDA